MKRLRVALVMLASLACMIWLLGYLPRAHGETIDRQTLCSIAHSILSEANGNEREAERIARERGFTRLQIWAAKKLCK